MSQAKKFLLFSVAVAVLVFFALAFAHQYEHSNHDSSCAICHWLSNLAIILPAVFLTLVCLQNNRLNLSDYPLTPELSSPTHFSRSPPF
ncbi:MAG: hypothetical protein A2142_05340 [candidate division Zixibacteria bacterium RBG_16_48_11]|nr:MAG: hypothetical protein A2142_05340 [candidate division Zixibacteria bacterium RBG_16_48_11]